MPQQLTLEQTSGLSEEAFVRHFRGICELSPWVAQGAWTHRPFDGFDALADGSWRHARGDAPEMAGVAEVPGQRRILQPRAEDRVLENLLDLVFERSSRFLAHDGVGRAQGAAGRQARG